MATDVEPATTRTGSLAQPGRTARRRGRDAKPFVVLAVAFVAGQLLARVIDWKGHA